MDSGASFLPSATCFDRYGEGQLPFRTGRAIPVAFFRFGMGSNGGARGPRHGPSVPGISSPLDEPVPGPGCSSRRCSPWCSPWGWGMLVVWRAPAEELHTGGSNERQNLQALVGWDVFLPHRVQQKGDRGTVQAGTTGATNPRYRPNPTPGPGAAGLARFTGKIKFTGHGALGIPAIDMSEEAACKAKYTTPPADRKEKTWLAGSGPTQLWRTYSSTVSAGRARGSDIPRAPRRPVGAGSERAGRYHPHVFWRHGRAKNIEIKNSDPLLHNIKAHREKRNRPFNVSQPQRRHDEGR